MLAKLFIFGLLCSTVIQAFPTTDDKSGENEEEPCLLPKRESDSKPESDSKSKSGSKPESDSKSNSTSVNDKIPCIDQIDWVKNATLETKNEYEKYYKRLTDNNNIDKKNLSILQEEHEHIESLIADSLKKVDVDLKNVRTNVQDQWNICRDELKSFSIMNRNLSAMAQSIRPKVIDLAKKLGLPPDAIDSLDHTLSRIVNFMFIIDMGKNTFRDIHSMIKEAAIKAEDGIKLEEKYKFTEEKVEPIGELKEKEKIGHVKEPATVKLREKERFIKLENEPHKVYKEPVYNIDESDIDNDPEFDNLIHDDQEIGNTNEELQEREKEAEIAEIAEEDRLYEKRRSSAENNLQQEEEIEENRMLEHSRLPMVHVL